MSPIETVRKNIADMVLRAQGIHDAASADTALVVRANHVADALLPHILVFRDMVEAAEGDGWDHSNPDILNRARNAYAALAGEAS